MLSWNVDHFGGGQTPARQNAVAKHLKDQDPDIIGIIEVENADIRKLMEKSFPDHDLILTDGPQLQEILVGRRRGVFEQKLFVQMREYQERNDKLRPEPMLSVRQGTVWTNILFLAHRQRERRGPVRDRFDNIRKVWSLTRALACVADGNDPRMLVLGDFNTMGLSFSGRKKADQRVAAAVEINGLMDPSPRWRGWCSSRSHTSRPTGAPPTASRTSTTCSPRRSWRSRSPAGRSPRLRPGDHSRRQEEVDHRHLRPQFDSRILLAETSGIGNSIGPLSYS